jgi:hypothetical protein
VGSQTSSGTILTKRMIHAARNASGERYPIVELSHPEGGHLTAVTHGGTGEIWYPVTVDGKHLTLIGTKYGYGPIRDKIIKGTLVSNAQGALAIEDAAGVVHPSIGRYALEDGRGVVYTKADLERVYDGALVYNIVKVRTR